MRYVQNEILKVKYVNNNSVDNVKTFTLQPLKTVSISLVKIH